jgi:hypothetical protein
LRFWKSDGLEATGDDEMNKSGTEARKPKEIRNWKSESGACPLFGIRFLDFSVLDFGILFFSK